MDERVKISFPLDRDTEDYPPADVETLWAIPRGGDQYEIDNIPFFVRSLACGDVVKAKEDSGALTFQEVTQRSGNSTLRVLVFNPNDVRDVRRTLESFGCSTELSHIPGLIAVMIPRQIDATRIIAFLGDGERHGKWEFEEACVYY